MERKKKTEEKVTLTVEAVKYASFADCYTRAPLFTMLRINNEGADSLTDFTLELVNDNGLVREFVKTIEEIPFESSVEVDTFDAVSPLYFAGLENVKDEIVKVVLKKDGNEVAVEEVTVTALPFEYWQGVGGREESLAAFVRPKLADCQRIKTEMSAQLKKWNVSGEFGGYDDADKNTVRRVIASLFTVLRRYGLTKTECDISAPAEAGGTRILGERSATALEVAVFVASVLESAGLNPLLIYGEKEITCGVWLYETCLPEVVSDDVERIGQYVSEGINGLSCFDIDDVFSDKTVAFSVSENHFAVKLDAGVYERVIDVKRARLNRITPLPSRNKTVKGYEILSEEETSPDAAPKDLFVKLKLNLEGKQTRDKQWERRLLDLTMKNALLNFRPAGNSAQIASADVDSTFSLVRSGEPVRLTPLNVSAVDLSARVSPFALGKELKGVKELLAEDAGGGILRTVENDENLSEILVKLYKKNKEADEESGSKILYLAYGMLKWGGDGDEKYAPLVLQPVEIKTGKGRVGYELVAGDEECSVNLTLLEYLKREYDIDVRGLDGNLQSLKISEVLAMVRMEVAGMKNWAVTDDVFLATFGFSRYQMWKDLRRNIGEFSKNKLVAAMLANKPLEKKDDAAVPTEDETSASDVLTPVWADSSQWDAVELSKLGSTFVLHGPPGTGKSQTITNIICNALHDGKRVLFVAEKQAALSVVKKRLDLLGVGDFCLELHSGKTNKSDVLQKLTNTLTLAGGQIDASVETDAARIDELRKSLGDPVAALHKKRRLGVSAYEAMLICNENSSAPDVMNIESVFYDKLTKEKVERYENMIRRAAVSARECGGVHNSPFADVRLTEYNADVKNAVYCSAEVVIAEIKHLKSYLALFLDLYRQRISRLTRKKLTLLEEIVKDLASGDLDKYFAVDEERFGTFYNANRRLDANLEKYYRSFDKLVDLKKDEKNELAKALTSDEDISLNKTAAAVVKKLSKTAKTKFTEESYLPSLELLLAVYEDTETIKGDAALSSGFTSAFGRTDFGDGRKKFLAPLYKLHDTAAEVFLDYNADGFNSTCIAAKSGFTAPVLNGLLTSLKGFYAAEKAFNKTIKANKEKLTEEDVLDAYAAKAGALIENVDMLANWCAYRAEAEALGKEGLTFVTDALENGDVTPDNVIAGFEKNVYGNFLKTTLSLDPVLARFSAALQEENTESLRLTYDEYAAVCREQIRSELISRLPLPSTEGKGGIELMNFRRYAKNNLRGMSLRKLFDEIPELLRTVAPCMLMSPATVAQYLRAENGLFDLVIFDEASQMPTAEAIGSLARGKAAIIVGDPKQLPPTAFFNSNRVDEDEIETEDMESVLDDCLALGVEERHLVWHYRSKHESLIAFSNAAYYGNKLCTFPSPDAPDSRVKFAYVEDGVYDRGFTKRNKAEAESLIAEVIRRLKDPVLSRSSIGVVTFSGVQKDYIERKLSAAITAAKLEEKAYDRDEPIFVKNLENVQGDERDVVLFSVCYGPDRNGRISLNFGPLNQAGGWRRLNVAASRAREEMVVFSSIRGAMIDLSKTNSKGVAGLKAFLDFAEKGKTSLAVSSVDVAKRKAGLGKYIAAALSQYGYECRYDVGVSDFKIDVAVLDPKNKHRYILAVMCDGTDRFSVKDRNVLQIQTLKRNNWNVIRVFSVNYFNNPKREIKRIKDMLDRITGRDKKAGSGVSRAQKPYKYANLTQLCASADYVTSGENDAEIVSRLKAVVAAEEPISEDFLIRRTLSTLGVIKYGNKVENRMLALIQTCGFRREKTMGAYYYRKTDKPISFDKFRVETGDRAARRFETDYTPYEIIALVKAALEDKVALYTDEIFNVACVVLGISRPGEKFAAYINDCVTLGEERGLFVRSVSDRISLA